ncbi:MAG: flotillin-like protein FloA [Oscillospiraceae bacterium]|nr:flotillin-like protein FloA [Oscillospiraceae bacterium]
MFNFLQFPLSGLYDIDAGLIIAGIAIVAGIALVTIFLNFVPVRLWVAASSAGVKVKMFSLVGMRLRRVRAAHVIEPLIKSRKAGLALDQNQLESHLLSGGRVNNVVDALIAAQRANLELSFERATAIDLAGRDVFEAVRMSVTPKIIVTPGVSAVAIDGVELRATAKITVRTNLDKLVGGAGEETIIARVGEGIVTTIGSAKTHKAVLENPHIISETVLNKGLDSGTAYEILSIDIADMDVGKNIGSRLQIEQAEADKLIAQAKAEERRAAAQAAEQEMRAKVVEAEAAVPMAFAEALKAGNIGIMDYVNVQNRQADTKMRENISSTNVNINGPVDPTNS